MLRLLQCPFTWVSCCGTTLCTMFCYQGLAPVAASTSPPPPPPAHPRVQVFIMVLCRTVGQRGGRDWLLGRESPRGGRPCNLDSWGARSQLGSVSIGRQERMATRPREESVTPPPRASLARVILSVRQKFSQSNFHRGCCNSVLDTNPSAMGSGAAREGGWGWGVGNFLHVGGIFEFPISF